ncbi:MAG: NAD(P)-dependent alcohol dehydrogenase [Acidimicrobiia bacterium]|nr:NAD(P)-dependent alcohol dehydrogenase [Acidimicrobiia bacterium]
MKAILARRYGSPDVLTLEEVDQPTPEGDQVLVKVHAAATNPSYWHRMEGKIPMLRQAYGDPEPTDHAMGGDCAGTVVAVGNDVTRFAVGDAVFGAAKGAFAEFALASEKALVHKPEKVSFIDAAAIPTGGLTALQGLRDQGHITSGQRVLIIGASGGVGIYAVQIAKSFDAQVTAVCSTRNIDMVTSIGADEVIDYTQQDWDGTGPYDLILDMVGDRDFEVYVKNLTETGRMVSIGALGMDTMAFIAKMGGYKASEQEEKVFSFIAQFTTEDLTTLAELMVSGAIKSVIDRTFPLEETAAAMAMQGGKRVSGKVVVVIDG